MLLVATIVLVICFVLCTAAVISFLWSFAAAGLLLYCAEIVTAGVGALELAMTTQINGLAAWAILCAAALVRNGRVT